MSGDYKVIQYQILLTNITRTVWQTVRRITNEILGVKGLRFLPVTPMSYHDRMSPYNIIQLSDEKKDNYQLRD